MYHKFPVINNDAEIIENDVGFNHNNNIVIVIMVTTRAMMRECGGGGVAVSASSRISASSRTKRVSHKGLVNLLTAKKVESFGADAKHSVNQTTTAKKKSSSGDMPIHSLPAHSQSHDERKNAAQLSQYKLTALEKDLLKYTKLKDEDDAIGSPYRGRITELSPHLKASTAIAIRKTPTKSPKGRGALTLQLQLKGLEVDIKKAITELKHERQLLEASLPSELQCCDFLTSNPQWTYCFGRYEGFRKEALEEFYHRMTRMDQKILELEEALKEDGIIATPNHNT
jgi:hypothetical protein